MSRRAGFTLIELVVVIMILGILAGVAAPKFFNTSGTATDNGVKQTLAIVRDAIELYNVEVRRHARLHRARARTSSPQWQIYARKFPSCPVGTEGRQHQADDGRHDDGGRHDRLDVSTRPRASSSAIARRRRPTVAAAYNTF